MNKAIAKIQKYLKKMNVENTGAVRKLVIEILGEVQKGKIEVADIDAIFKASIKELNK